MITSATRTIEDQKQNWLDGKMEQWYSSKSNHIAVATSFILMNLCLVGGAVLLVVLVEMKAKGSGIPEIKCYLNGVKIPGVIRAKTLFSKVFGVICSVSGGMLVGKEGPLCHTGAILGALISQGRREVARSISGSGPPPKAGGREVKNMSRPGFFFNDRIKRDLVTVGVAAGVGTAFASPLGGTLFAFEEASSHWSGEMTWLALTASVVAVITVQACSSHPFDMVKPTALVDFGCFEGTCKGNRNPVPKISLAVVGISMVLGCMGGLSGESGMQENHTCINTSASIHT